MIQSIVKKIASKFKTYGGVTGDSIHPLDEALAGQAPVFALGVDVAEVVKMVLKERDEHMIILANRMRILIEKGTGVGYEDALHSGLSAKIDTTLYQILDAIEVNE